MHISYYEHKKLTGTTRYASLNTHLGAEQGRRDDLECLAYTLVYLLKGELPWQGVAAKNKQEKYDRIRDMKLALPSETLCRGLEPEFARLLAYSRSLKFEEKPDYSQLRKMFREAFYRRRYDAGFQLDWIRLQLPTAVPEEKDGSSSISNQAEIDPAPVSRNLLLLPSQPVVGAEYWNATQRSAGCTVGDKVEPAVEAREATKESLVRETSITKVREQSLAQSQTSPRKVSYEARKKSQAWAEEREEESKATARCNFRQEDIVEDHSVYG